MIFDDREDVNTGKRIDKMLVAPALVLADESGAESSESSSSSDSAPLSAKTLPYSFDVQGVPMSRPGTSTKTKTSHIVYITALPPSTTSLQPVLPKLDRQILSDAGVLPYAIPVSFGVGMVLGIVITALLRAWWRGHGYKYRCRSVYPRTTGDGIRNSPLSKG